MEKENLKSQNLSATNTYCVVSIKDLDAHSY